MRSNKSFYLTMIPIIISVIIGVILLAFHNRVGLNSKAALIAAGERSDMNSQISELNSEKEELQAQISEYDTVIDENRTLMTEVDSLTEQLNSYNSDIENASQLNSDLKSQLSEKQTYSDNLSSVAQKTDGSSTTLSEGEHKCPADIDSGRYRAEGSGRLLVYDIANNVTASINLSTIDSHSYEFEINSGEKIKTDGSVTLTAVLEED